MAQMIFTLKLMLESPEVNPEPVVEKSKDIVLQHEGEVGKVEIENIAFGLKAVKLYIVIDENKEISGIENNLTNLEGVRSVEVIDMRRALG